MPNRGAPTGLAAACPVCRCATVSSAWTLEGTPFLRCGECRCIFALPATSRGEEARYTGDYHEARGHGSSEGGIVRAKRTGFERLLALLGTPPQPSSRGAAKSLRRDSSSCREAILRARSCSKSSTSSESLRSQSKSPA